VGTNDDIKGEGIDQIEYLVAGKVYLLEGLAFTGLWNGVINFEFKHRNAISKKFKLPHQRM
jgi:hypothetical protein